MMNKENLRWGIIGCGAVGTDLKVPAVTQNTSWIFGLRLAVVCAEMFEGPKDFAERQWRFQI